MNEALIKSIIQYKLTAARKVVNKLPADISNDVKNLGRIILESLNGNLEESNNHPENKIRSKGVINNIKIE